MLLGGTLDSAMVLTIARAEGLAACAQSFNDGRRHAMELDAARRVAAALGATEQSAARFDLRQFGGSPLTNDIAVPKVRTTQAMAHGIPGTNVSARNTIFLSFTLAQAETPGACDIFVGFNALDYSGYPDCQPRYIAPCPAMANLDARAVAAGV